MLNGITTEGLIISKDNRINCVFKLKFRSADESKLTTKREWGKGREGNNKNNKNKKVIQRT